MKPLSARVILILGSISMCAASGAPSKNDVVAATTTSRHEPRQVFEVGQSTSSAPAQSRDHGAAQSSDVLTESVSDEQVWPGSLIASLLAVLGLVVLARRRVTRRRESREAPESCEGSSEEQADPSGGTQGDPALRSRERAV